MAAQQGAPDVALATLAGDFFVWWELCMGS